MFSILRAAPELFYILNRLPETLTQERHMSNHLGDESDRYQSRYRNLPGFC